MAINGKRYSFEDITATMPHGTLIDFESIEYSDKIEIEASYGKGSNPRGYGRGNYSAEAKVIMLREEFNRLLEHLKGQGIKALYRTPPFTITVSYANDDQPMSTDVLRDCVFTERSGSSSQGDSSTKVELSLLVLSPIEYNGLPAN